MSPLEILYAALAALLVLAAAWLAARDVLRFRDPRSAPALALAAASDPATTCTPWQRARQLLRRWSWLLLFAAGLGLYPVQIYWQVRYAASQAASGDAAQAAAAQAAKIVDPALVFSKMSIAAGVFALINLLAWAALNMVLPVLADWAKGAYADSAKAAGVGLDSPVVGFKRTFLTQSGLWRILLYFLGFGLQLFAAGLGVYAAFTIQ